MDIKNSLLQLGLNRNEIAVYTSLLKHGLTQAGPIVKETRLHRMIVYNALEKLIHEGLASVVHKKNIQLFQPADPKALSVKTERQHQLALQLIPELKKMQIKHNDLVDIQTLVGHEGFVQNLQDVIESAAKQSDKTMRIIGGAKDTDFYNAVGEWYPNYVELLKKTRVWKKLLAPDSFSKEFKKKFVAEDRTELRTLPKGLSSPTYTRITKELVAIEMYHPQPIVIQIRNAGIAKGYLDSWLLLWNNSKAEKFSK